MLAYKSIFVLSSLLLGAVSSLSLDQSDDEDSIRQLRRTRIYDREGPGGAAAKASASGHVSQRNPYWDLLLPPTTVSTCNICTVPGATVALAGASVKMKSGTVKCSKLELMGSTGELQGDLCTEAQTLASAHCGCVISGSLESRPIPATCSARNLDATEREWLSAHNSRREYWHTFYDVKVSEVCWDHSLAAQAQYFADYLTSTCQRKHDLTQPANPASYGSAYCRNAGENLAFDSSSDGGRSPVEVSIAWTDKEFLKDYPSDGHMTQVLWKPTKFIGCAQSTNPACPYKNVQVCRYVKYGNCNCGNDENCRDNMLLGNSPCGTDEVTTSLQEYTQCFEASD